jgi:hypothetical protein
VGITQKKAYNIQNKTNFLKSSNKATFFPISGRYLQKCNFHIIYNFPPPPSLRYTACYISVRHNTNFKNLRRICSCLKFKIQKLGTNSQILFFFLFCGKTSLLLHRWFISSSIPPLPEALTRKIKEQYISRHAPSHNAFLSLPSLHFFVYLYPSVGDNLKII